MQDSEHSGSERSGQVLTCANLREYFHDALQSALAHQHLSVEDQTEHYVVNVLTLFSRSEQLFQQTPDGVRLKPLVQMMSEALEAPTAQERERGFEMRKLSALGDFIQEQQRAAQQSQQYSRCLPPVQSLPPRQHVGDDYQRIGADEEERGPVMLHACGVHANDNLRAVKYAEGEPDQRDPENRHCVFSL